MDLPPPSIIEQKVFLGFSEKLEIYRNASGLQGWCSVEKMSVLIDLILQEKLRIIVEIGVFGGKSLIPMAEALKINQEGKVFGIDPWSPVEALWGIKNRENRIFWGQIEYQEIYEDLLKKIEQLGLEEHIVLICSTSAKAEPIEEIDLLHMDGNHSLEAINHDVAKWVPLVRKGGVIVLNDLDWTEDKKQICAEAVHWLNENCEKEREYKSGSSTWGIWRKR